MVGRKLLTSLSPLLFAQPDTKQALLGSLAQRCKVFVFFSHTSQPLPANSPLSRPGASRWFVGSLWKQESSEGSVRLCCFPVLTEKLCHCLLGCYKQDYMVSLESFYFSKTKIFDYSWLKYLEFFLTSQKSTTWVGGGKHRLLSQVSRYFLWCCTCLKVHTLPGKLPAKSLSSFNCFQF